MSFFEIFFIFAHLLIETKLFCFYQKFISSVVQRNHGGTKSVTNKQTNNKRTNTTNDHNSPPGFFQNPRTNNHYKYEFSSFQSSLNKKSTLQETRALKNDATGQKNDFFRIFLFCCTSSRQDETFLLLPNYISSAVQRNHGGTKKKRYIEQRRTNDERRTTNDERTNERRTTLTMIIARQDSFRILGLTTDIF